jgi:LacI family transcriptional regulator
MGRFLAGLGHRRIAYFSAAHDQNWSRDRLTGIAEALGHAGTVRAYTELYDQAAAESAHRRFDAETGKLARTLAVSAAPGVRVAASVVTSLHAQVSDSLQWAQMEEQLKPLMRRALENADSTAWVAANDYMALACLRFLRQEGLAVPGRLSVAGFDDMTAAFAAGLTSYNFNRPAAVHAALSFLAGAGVQRLPHAAGEPVAIDGFVSPRASTAPPRK